LTSLGSAYRLIELAHGFDGYLAPHEGYFYVLEAVPMIPPFIFFNIWNPGRVAGSGFGIPVIEAPQREILVGENLTVTEPYKTTPSEGF
jgi:hypothetical protein